MWSVSINAVGWIIAATTSAVIALGLWRYQLIAKRRYEIAEQLVTVATRAVGVLQSARGMWRYQGEGSTRPRDSKETPEKTDYLDRQYVPIERLQKSEDAFQDLFRARVLAEVHFGSVAAVPFTTLIGVRQKIVTAAEFRMLHIAPGRGEYDEAAKQEDIRNSYILFSTGEENAVTKEINVALERIKAMADDELRPHWITRFFPMISQQRAKRIAAWWFDLYRRYRSTQS